MRLWIGMLAIGFLAGACIDPDTGRYSESCLPIINGVPDESPEHLAVVGVLSQASICTGTLISPRVVLTAAHCLYGMGGPENFSAAFGNQLSGAVQRQVSEILVHPNYRSNRLLYDIGLMRLSADPPPGVVPIPFLPHHIGLNEADIGAPLEYVGFGQTHTGEFGVKMSVTNQLEWICVSDSICELDFGLITFPNTICTDMVPGGTCSGDSGGPSLFIRNDQEYVAGITSFGDGECAYYGCSTKVDEYEDFIVSFAGDPLGTECEQDRDCFSGNCRDGVCCDTTCPGRCESCNQQGGPGTCLPAPDGTECHDSDVCNGDEVCQSGSCVPGVPLACSDNIECTFDTCNPARGCDFEPLATECDDGNLCTRDICDRATDCRYEPMPDGMSCGDCQICSSGACISDPACKDSGCASTGPPSGSISLIFLFPLGLILWRRAGQRSAGRKSRSLSWMDV